MAPPRRHVAIRPFRTHQPSPPHHPLDYIIEGSAPEGEPAAGPSLEEPQHTMDQEAGILTTLLWPFFKCLRLPDHPLPWVRLRSMRKGASFIITNVSLWWSLANHQSMFRPYCSEKWTKCRTSGNLPTVCKKSLISSMWQWRRCCHISDTSRWFIPVRMKELMDFWNPCSHFSYISVIYIKIMGKGIEEAIGALYSCLTGSTSCWRWTLLSW